MKNEKIEIREVSYNDALRLILKNEDLEAKRRGVVFTNERKENATKYFKENKTFKYYMANDFAVIAVCFRKEFNTYEISEIYVAKQYRGKHIASKLFKAAFSKFNDKDWIVEVNAENIQGICFYSKMGFKQLLFIDHDSYKIPFKTILMVKKVNGSANFRIPKSKK